MWKVRTTHCKECGSTSEDHKYQTFGVSKIKKKIVIFCLFFSLKLSPTTSVEVVYDANVRMENICFSYVGLLSFIFLSYLLFIMLKLLETRIHDEMLQQVFVSGGEERWHLQCFVQTMESTLHLVRKCIKQQVNSISPLVKAGWTIRSTWCPLFFTWRVFSQRPVKCERWCCSGGDKGWGITASEKRHEERSQRNAKSGFCLPASDCSTINSFRKVCQGGSEWMPIITPNNVSPQYFNDVPFAEKPLSSEELIGF